MYTSSDNIGICLLNLLSTMLYCNKSKQDGLLLLIDHKKLIDSIDHKYIYNTMGRVNFGNNLIEWVKLFLTARRSCTPLPGRSPYTEDTSGERCSSRG